MGFSCSSRMVGCSRSAQINRPHRNSFTFTTRIASDPDHKITQHFYSQTFLPPKKKKERVYKIET
jgi:hypothetical protein